MAVESDVVARRVCFPRSWRNKCALFPAFNHGGSGRVRRVSRQDKGIFFMMNLGGEVFEVLDRSPKSVVRALGLAFGRNGELHEHTA